MNEKEESIGDNPFQPKWEVFLKTVYFKEIQRLVEKYPEKRSLEVDFKKIEEFDFELADELLANPDYLLSAAQQAIKEIDVPALELEEFTPHIRIFNLPKESTPVLRNISSKHLGKLITVEGIVKQMTDVLPKLSIAVWECRHCGNTYHIPQEKQIEKKPVMCECKHREFNLVEEQSNFMDYQKIQIQEPLELLKGSEQATSLDIYVSDDLVNRIAPGDRTKITGMLRLIPPKEKKIVYGRYIEATHLEETAREYDEVEITPEEEQKIKEMASDPKIYETLTQSIAPAIYGHETIKEAVALQLFGGVKKALPNDQKIRGNIHVLVIGDPGTAKSQLLQAANKIAPKSVYVSGKSSSGVGLCVAPETIILNDNGFKEIKDYVETNFSEEKAVEELPGAFSNKFNEKNYCLDEKMKISQGNVSRIWRIKAPKKMFHIKTQFGKEIELTPNTSLIRLKENKIEWIKSSELKENDFIACSRFLPEGKIKNIKTILFLKDNNIKIAANLAEEFNEISNILIEKRKYSSLQEIAKKLGKSRETIYSWRNQKHHHGMPLKKFILLAIEAGYDLEKLSEKINYCFNYHGKEIKIPKFIDEKEIAYLAGLILGDGNIQESSKTASIRIFSADKEILQEIDRIVSKHFDLIPEKIDDGKRVPARRIKFKIFAEIMKAFGLNSKKNEIKISHLASEMNNEVLAALLQGLFDTDGYVTNPKRKGSTHIGLSTISKKLAQTTQLSLLKFGIQSKVRLRKKAGTIAKGKNITVTSRFDQYYLEIRGKENHLKFNEKIGFKLERKKNALNKIISKVKKSNPNLDIIPIKHKGMHYTRESISKKKNKNILEHALAESDIYWEKITEKKEFTPEYKFVYDFSIEENHNFIGNGFFVHNTASAVKDDFGEGGWTLKAGALVLASGGAAFIDEFDKMEPEDRSAMHEAMEQGMVSVAKAGMVTRFKTDTSILAAANPKYSRFDPFQSFIEQINLPPTLISRFDLFFMLRDVLDRTKDTEIADHILQTHRVGEIMRQELTKKSKKEHEEISEMKEKITPKIDVEMLKKYVAYARQNIFPAMTKKAIETISTFYVDLRESGRKEGAYAATHRQLEGLVRLSEASARVRLSDKVTEEDTSRAIRLFKTSMQELVTDPETGRIDVDIITSGRTHTQLNNIKTILAIIKSKAIELDMVPIEEVIEEAKTQGIESEAVRETIIKLEKAGDIYKPRHGFVKPTQK
ncbi:MAG: ATP-binding protein [Candidatus Diapherotrites archaeon]|nr:ATP-binding protein [Candidatus Diapherotrites archaeon]